MLRFEDGDNLVTELVRLARRERLKTATLVFIGALKRGKLVTGPKKPVIPPAANWTGFKDGWEVMGLGTIVSGKEGPQVHVHTTMGKKTKTLTGCVRKESEIFLVIEAVVFELKGVKASKNIDPKTGLNLLRVS